MILLPTRSTRTDPLFPYTTLFRSFFRAGARLADVERREDALVRNLAVEHDFGVTGALEFLEDHFVHAAAGVDQRGGDDRERAAFLDVARGTEEALGALERVGVDAAGQRSEERRVGKECVSTCRTRWAPG